MTSVQFDGNDSDDDYEDTILTKANNTGSKRSVKGRRSGNGAKRQKTDKTARGIAVDDDTNGTLYVPPYNIRHMRNGPEPPPVKLKEGDGVYIVKTVTASNSKLPDGSPTQLDALATEISILGAVQLPHCYDRVMFEEDSRRSDATTKQAKKKKSARPSSKDSEDEDIDSTGTHLDSTVPPVHNLSEIYDIIATKLLKQNFVQACTTFSDEGLRVVTMCSGTESPILAARLLDDALKRQGSSRFPINHLASAEIEAWKQAYIYRNFEPPILFRDVTEFQKDSENAHTAFGGFSKQPKNVHVLIAGSSCVDYSSLNNKKKSFGEAGESFDTFNGVKAYVENHRPAVVILENVYNADWNSFQNEYAKIDYLGIVMYVDTKDFYIPQTRKRGYMVAFDTRRAKAIGLDLKTAAEKLIQCVESLTQRASSPYSDFIYRDDDPELKLAMKEIPESNSNKIDWKACKLRYSAYRVSQKLGNKRPLTFWKPGGRSQFLDYGWHRWVLAQRERIFDTLDIDLLGFLAERHYDMTYKSRVVELSQNVDRDLDSRHWGIVGCITPSGMPWDTLRGGPVSGKEALALQGIPVEELSLNRETSKQLQDLAGNAMTSTVIGSVLFSAIVASVVETDKGTASHAMPDQESMFKCTNTSSAKCSESCSSQAIDENVALDDIESLSSSHSMQLVRIQAQGTHVSVEHLKEFAAQSVSICKCDGIGKDMGRKIFVCSLCGHTACSHCAGNPLHKYRDITVAVLQQRRSPEDFQEMVTKAFPPSVALQLPEQTLAQICVVFGNARQFNDHKTQQDNVDAGKLNTTSLEKVRKAVRDAFESRCYFQSVKQGPICRVIYESKNARLELSLIPQNGIDRTEVACQWLLYAKPTCDEFPNSVVRDLFNHPIARMEPSGDDVLQGQWHVWDPSMPYAQLEVQGQGTRLPSWEQKLGLQKEVFRNLEVYPVLSVQMSNEGNESLDPVAQQVAKSICGDFELLPDCGTACGSLHRKMALDPKSKSQYLFLDPKPLQNAYLDRMVFADTHHRRSYGVERGILAEFCKAWRPNSLTLTDKNVRKAKVACRLVDLWHEATDMKIAIPTNEMSFWKIPSDTLVRTTMDCNDFVPALIIKLPTHQIPQPQWLRGSKQSIQLINKPVALRPFQWLTKSLAQGLVCKPVQIDISGSVESCFACSPDAPLLEWRYTSKLAGPNSLSKPFVRPYENVEAATKYEKALLSRIAPVTSDIHVHEDHAWLVVKLDLSTVVHRLHNKLSLQTAGTKATWNFVHNTGLGMVPTFPKLELPSPDAQQPLWPVNDKLYSTKQSSKRPVLFQNRNLWDTQRKALAWMLDVECGVDWEEWEAEIYDTPALALQLRVEALVPKRVHGGIVADKVGAGKTTTSLALMARDIENVSTKLSSASSYANKIVSGATLVLVPRRIMSQWLEEARACFGASWVDKNLIKVTNTNIESVTVHQIQHAKIILASWDLFCTETYWTLMSHVCCASKGPQNGGRAFKQWLDESTADLEDIVSKCGQDLELKKFQKHREDQKTFKRSKYVRFQGFEELNRRKNKKPREAEDASNGQGEASDAIQSDNQLNPDGGQKQGQTKKAHRSQGKAVVDTETQKVTAELLKTGSLYYPGAVEGDMKVADEQFDLLSEWDSTRQIPALLHFFEFRRLVVDEFTYLDARALLAIQKLTASRRWMLSATPSIAISESIDCMAALIGTRVSSEQEVNSSFDFKGARSVNQSEKTYAEDFRDRIEKRPPAWDTMRNVRSRAFVDKFIRQNEADHISVQSKVEYVVLQQSPLEACIYYQVFQRLKSSFKAGKATDHILGSEIKLPPAGSQEEALMVCHANLIESFSKSTDLEAIDNIILNVQQMVQETYKDIVKCLQEVFWYWREGQAKDDCETDSAHFTTFLYSILHKSLGDSSVSALMIRTAAFARENSQQPKFMASRKTGSSKNKYSSDATGKDQNDNSLTKISSKAGTDKTSIFKKKSSRVEDGKFVYDPDEKHDLTTRRNELRERATDLNDKSIRLVDQTQQLRLLQNIRVIVDGNSTLVCAACATPKTVNEQSLAGQCGHLICNSCLTERLCGSLDIGGCPVTDCSANIKDCCVPADFYSCVGDASTSSFGSKMDAVAEKIESITEKDRILVFVQFDAHACQIRKLLTGRKIGYIDGTKGQQGIQNFAKGKDLKKRVLILKLDSADSAGWNLQTANHVMFIAPFLAKTQYDYDATMKQAIGRALRFGQKKDVKIYHYISSRTMDVNIIQSRLNKKIVKQDDGTYALFDFDDQLVDGTEDLAGPSLDAAFVPVFDDEDGTGAMEVDA